MEEFDALVKELAEKRIDRDVPNSTAEHALIGIKYLFRYAEGVVRVITKSLNVTFWKNLESEIVGFLDREATANTLEIISLESLKGNTVAEMLRQRYTTRVSFYILDWETTKFFS